MLTRLQVKGFKNLLDIDVEFGPFTCIAGLNAVGKSNLFDAMRFLHLLTEKKSIMEAVQSLRDMQGRAPQPAELFSRLGDFTAPEMQFTADLIVDRNVEDAFGVGAKASISTLRYDVAFRLNLDSGILELARESLKPIPLREARQHIGFARSTEFLKSVVAGRRTVSLISTSEDQVITVHQEGHGGRKLPAPKSSRTVLGGTEVADFPTILAARQEMAQWRTLLLEPSAMRTSSAYRDPQHIDVRGANLANAIFRMASRESEPGQVYAELANRLSRLVDDVRAVRVVDNDKFETRTLEVQGSDGVFHPAHSLSDGTLRFLVLSVLDIDPEVRGILCLEEPENGIHPDRIPVMMDLLNDIAVDPEFPVGPDNPMRQVVVNTHSPLVVSTLSKHDLIYMDSVQIGNGVKRGVVPRLCYHPENWRAKQNKAAANIAKGQLADYIGVPRGGFQRDLLKKFDDAETTTP